MFEFRAKIYIERSLPTSDIRSTKMIVYIFVIIIYCIFSREHILTVNKSSTIFFPLSFERGINFDTQRRTWPLFDGRGNSWRSQRIETSKVFWEIRSKKKKDQNKNSGAWLRQVVFWKLRIPGNFSFSSFDPIFIRFFSPRFLSSFLSSSLIILYGKTKIHGEN